MKKIIISIVSIAFFGILLISCENVTNSEDNTGLNNTNLNKKNIKEVYTYKLEPCYTKLPDAHGVIKIQMIVEGEYSFDLRAFNLESKAEYWLKAEDAKTPTPIACPYTITDELGGVSTKNGNLKMTGVIDLAEGYTIYLFRIDNGENICFHTILEIEKTLF